MFIQYIRSLKKGVSPLIATILLVVVSVILVVVVLTWGKDFVSDSLVTTTDILDTYKEADLGFYLKIFRSGNGRIIVDYFPPSNSPLQDLNLVGYGLLGYTEHVVPFEPPILLEANKRGQIIDHGIMLDRFDLLLYTEDGYVITKKNISQEILQPSNCPEGYIPVPGNYLYGTAYPGQNGFCVMKYEAKTDANSDTQEACRYTSSYYQWYHNTNTESDCYTFNYNIVSTAENRPITNVTQEESISLCSSISFSNFDNNAHLITNDEWMTIVRNIEMVPNNWSEGEVGKGYLPRGNSNNNFSSDGYVADGFNELSEEYKRTLTLSNGQVIWDLSGNVYSWLDNSLSYNINNPPRFFDVNDSQVFSGGRWYDYSKGGGTGYYIKWDNLGNDSVLKYKDLFLLTSGTYNSQTNNGAVGRIYLRGSTTTRVFARGGYWSNGLIAGPLAMYLNYGSADLYITIGLRCVVVSE